MTNVMFAAFRDELEKIAFSKQAMIGDVAKSVIPGASRSAFLAGAKKVVSPITMGAPAGAGAAVARARRAANIPNLGANRGLQGAQLRATVGKGSIGGAPPLSMAMPA